MSGVKTYHQHIDLNPQGVPVIKGTRFKVFILVEEKLAWGWDAEEMHRQHPSLTPEQIQATLNYYAEHYEEIHKDISKRRKKVKKMREDNGLPQFSKKLR